MYSHKDIDEKWQKRWEEEGLFHADDTSDAPKYYALIEFPYPSGAGLHIGHPRSYTALDVIARKRRAEGFNVLYPIGWDAFGLPTENYAIKTGRKPQDVTAENIATYRRQLKSLGLSFDWSREVNTTDPKYYRWTQWMFLEFFKAGMAYKAKVPINWCVSCKIGLANEEVVGGACERCGGAVEKRDKEQWMIAITRYADRLLAGLETVDYLPKIRKQQEDWIGRSEGADVNFVLQCDSTRVGDVTVFTTRPDTLFGATYVVLAPEHPLVAALLPSVKNRTAVKKYIKEAIVKTDMDRANAEREKTGVALKGVTAMNPVNGELLPVWIADYVMMGYGTGAIMAVPAHDERDFAFAKQFELLVRQVVQSPALDIVPPGTVKQIAGAIAEEIHVEHSCFSGSGIAINSNFLDGFTTAEAKERMTEWLEREGHGCRAVHYKLRDWVFSRQRYWGEPIPLVHCDSCSPKTDGWVPVPEIELPVRLPDVESYQPTDSGESPLATMTDWVETTCPRCGGVARRETDTMPNWAGSSWYFLRYADPHNAERFASPEALRRWMPVDLYDGGMEHTVLHLLYSRFWNLFLYDRGHVPVAEPYARRTSHGLILAADGSKMSKSKGNVVNPDEIVERYGADTLRVYELFIGPFGEAVPWSERGVVGVRRFLDRVARLPDLVASEESKVMTRALHKMVKKVSEDIEAIRFNTAVAAMMSFVNIVYGEGSLRRESLAMFLKVLHPFAPHLTDELHERMGGGFLMREGWPRFDEAFARDGMVTIGVQINGKVRGDVTLAVDATEAEARQAVLANPNVAKYLEGKEIKKFLYIPGRIVNVVVEL